MNRWLLYQKERFPLLQHAPLVLVFAFSGLCYSRLLRGALAWPSPQALVTAFLVALFFFLQLRIADEFKDAEEDARFRPYRPVPRGLVKLRELGWIFALLALAQLVLTTLLFSPLVWLLAIAWLYLAAMSKEFFAREWLSARPVLYLLTHMGIMPMIDLYITSVDWRVAGAAWPDPGIYWFLAVSFFNGVAIEFGRKIRAPGDEEEGVRTYSALWGRRPATAIWLAALAANAAAAVMAARNIDFFLPALLFLGILFLVALALAASFLKRPTSATAKRLETYSGVWTLLMYLSLGPLSLGLSLLFP